MMHVSHGSLFWPGLDRVGQAGVAGGLAQVSEWTMRPRKCRWGSLRDGEGGLEEHGADDGGADDGGADVGRPPR